MAAEMQQLLPQYAHYYVSVGPGEPVPGAHAIVLQPGSAGDLWLQLKRAFRGRRIGMAAVLFTPDAAHAPLRAAAFALAPRKILAYNSRLERHHLQLSCPLASFLFWRGVPLDRIWLRPWWLWPWRSDRTDRRSEAIVIQGRATSPARGRMAVVSPYVPWPLAHGGAVRMYHLLREAAVTHDIWLFAFREDESGDALEPLRAICSRITLFTKPRYREPRWSTVKPPEAGEYDCPALHRALADARDEGFKTVQLEYTQMARYRGDILVEHDITFDLHRQVYQRNGTVGAWWNWWRWVRFEKQALRRAGRVVVMSPKDAALSGHAGAVVIPNGVDLDRFRPSPEPSGRRVLFIGSFRHFPNMLAYRFLVEEVWPLVEQRFPGVELTAVAGPQPLLHWQNMTGERSIPNPPGVRLLEFVTDVKALYDETNLAVVPTPVSAGTNVKVLEAMAMQRAVVSTTSGCAGLGLVHGVSVWIADGADAFAAGIGELLNDWALRASIAQAARHHAERHFSWRRLGALQRRLWTEVAPPPLLIRTACGEDLAAIAAIQGASPEASQWPPGDYLKHECRVGELDRKIAGFVTWRRTAPGEQEILNLAVDPASRRIGVGSQLLAAALEGSHGDWYLEVRESNLDAQKLYKRFGFQPTGRRPGYYTDSHECGIVMALRSC
jgi:ribosomal protein S18 acetylase RimI-like enzyme